MTIKSISEKQAEALLESSRAQYEAEVEALRAQESVIREKVQQELHTAKLYGDDLTPEQLYKKAIIESQYDPVVWDEWQQIRSDEYQKRNDAIQELRSAMRGQQVNLRQADAPWQICYGHVRTGGLITFLTTDQPGGGEFLHVGFTLAGHPIDSVRKVFINKEEVEWEGDLTTDDSSWGKTGSKWENLVFISLRTLGDHTEVNWDLYDQGNTAHGIIPPLFPGKWTSLHIQQGRAFVYMILKFDNEIFANGFPDVEFEIYGNNKIYDPRDDSTGYSANAALIIAHHLTNSVYGLGGTWANVIDETQLEAQADVCDEDVALAAGGTENRYEINGILTTEQTRRDQLAQLLTATGGSLSYVNCKWFLNVADWPASAGTLVLTKADCLSSLQVSLMPGRSERFNGVRGTYIDANDSFTQKEFPVVKNALYLSEDQSLENWLDITLPCTTSAAAAQRLAKIELERVRQGITVKGTFALRAFQAQVGDVIGLTNADFGWSAKLFEVTYCRLVLGGEGGEPLFQVALELRETASGVFDWNSGEETTVDLAQNTNLPSPSTIYKPTAVTCASGTDHLYVNPDGTVFSRIYVSWTAPVDPFVKNGGYIDIAYKKSADANWIDATPVPGASTFAYILDVQDNVLYDVRVRSRNVLGVVSAWTVVNSHLVLGKSAAPSDVSGFAASVQSYGLFLAWDEIPDVDRAFYRIKNGSWASGTVIAETRSTSFRWTNQAAASYSLTIKAVDTSGNESTNEATVTLAISAPSTPTVTGAIEGENLALSWNDCATDYAIADYAISYGDAAGDNAVTTIKGTKHSLFVNWSGIRRFWVQARDIAGNAGTAGSALIELVAAPAVTGLVADVIDNNVLLHWTASAGGTLPVKSYEVRKGAVFAAATVIGQFFGTFSTIFETTAGSYTYWIVPIDSAGAYGLETYLVAAVLKPPDLVIYLDQELTSSTTSYNVIDEGGGVFIAPVPASDTWQQHFDRHGWTQIQNQIDAGYDMFCRPEAAYGYWEKIIDYGTTLTGTIIRLNWSEEELISTIDVTPVLGYSVDGVTYTEEEDVTSLYGTSFRYVKARLEFGTVPDTAGQASGLLLAIMQG